MRKTFLALALAVFTSSLVACNWFGNNGSEQATVNPYANLPDEDQLRLRAQKRWDALIAMDMSTVYGFASPNYRSTYDLSHFIAQYGGQIRRKRVEVQAIKIDDTETNARVDVAVYSELEGFPGSGPIEVSTLSKDTWVKRDGMWWFVEPR